MTLRRTRTVVALAAGMTMVAIPARAAPGDPVAEGDAGWAVVGSTEIEYIAGCSTAGPREAETDVVSVPGVITYLDSRSECAIDDTGEIATATVTGGRFRFDALREWDGPTIRLASYTVTCSTTATGSDVVFEFADLSGIDTPSPMPLNHTVVVPGPTDRPMATVTFNETPPPDPLTGGTTAHLMHIRVFPEGGPTSGEIYVGTASCVPVS